jgi:drug/metabolite transporter (DMT)-like permease
MQAERPFGIAAISIKLILCLSWSMQQITVKIALPEVGPMLQGALRSSGAACCVGLYLLMRRGRSGWVPGLALPGLFCGLLFGAEFIALFQSLSYTDAARVVMFLYTAPFFVALGGHLLFPGERLDIKAVTGIVVAFAGVVIALDPANDAKTSTWFGDLLALAAGAIWGLTTLVIKGTSLRFAPAAQILYYQLLVSTGMFWLAAPLAGETLTLPLNGVTVAALAYQTFWVATISYLVWFAMIGRYSATKLSVVTFITPLMGAGLGVTVLGEELHSKQIFAVFAVALGILLVSLPRGAQCQSVPRPL